MKLALCIATATIFMATACSFEPSKPLDQQLAEATTPAERKETLLTACISEAEWPTAKSKRSHGGGQFRHSAHSPYVSEVREMRALCTQMDAATEKQALAYKCAEQVAMKAQKERDGGADHAARIQHICEEMTGTKITR